MPYGDACTPYVDRAGRRRRLQGIANGFGELYERLYGKGSGSPRPASS